MRNGSDETTWLPTVASVRAAVLITATQNGVSAPADTAALVDQAAWLVTQHAGTPVWCGAAVAAALLRPDNPARGEDLLEAGRQRARLLASLAIDERERALERDGAPAPMPRWISAGRRARARYDLAECVAVATQGVSAAPGEAVAVARAHTVIASLRGAVEDAGHALVGKGLDHRIVRALFAAAGLTAPAFLRAAQGPAWTDWLEHTHSGLAWPFITDARMCAQVFALVAHPDEIGAVVAAAEWLTVGGFYKTRARQIDEADRRRVMARAEARRRGFPIKA